MFRTPFLRLFHHLSRPVARKTHLGNRLQLEILEDRLALSNYYAAAGVNDVISGLPLTQSLAAIQQGLDRTAPPGDTLSTSGNSPHPLTQANYDGQKVLLDGTGNANGSTGGAANIHNAASAGNLTSNITTAPGNSHNDSAGSHVEAAASISIPTNNLINESNGPENFPAAAPNNGLGITIYGEYAPPISFLTILQNQIYSCQLVTTEGMIHNGNAAGLTVKNNSVYNVSNIGIDYNDGDTSMGSAAYKSESPNDADIHFADPKFVKAIADDFASLTGNSALEIDSY